MSGPDERPATWIKGRSDFARRSTVPNEYPSTMSELSELLSPYRLGEMKLKNRVVMAPMTRARAGAEMTANELMAEYYRQRSGAGLIVTEGTFPSRMGVGWLHAPGIYTDAMAEAWRPTVEAVHQNDAKIFLQLWHTGRASHSDFLDGKLPLAPSPIKKGGRPIPTPKSNGESLEHEVPRALDIDEIPAIVDEYRQAALRAKMVGFDGVEIHAANGYLIDTFLQSKTNHREDDYGGSVEKRYRFLKEVTEAVTSVWPGNRVGVRLSPNGDFNDMGSPDYREQFLYVAEQLQAFGLAYLHLLIGTGFGFHELGEPMQLSDFQEVYAGPIMANVGYDRESAEAVIDSGEAALVSFGRPFISNPDLVERFQNDWPLAEPAPQEVWYSFDAKGYTDWPTYQQQSVGTS